MTMNCPKSLKNKSVKRNEIIERKISSEILFAREVIKKQSTKYIIPIAKDGIFVACDAAAIGNKYR
jgi:hypothetical protein